jgi:hypothetical protein
VVLSRKQIVTLVATIALLAALLLTALGFGPSRVGPGPAFAPAPPPPPAVGCNAGNGNGNEGCDPGNSAPQNKGGDEVKTPPFNSTPNPGGNNT